MEIERKFLVNDISELDLRNYEFKKITQDYLYADKCSAVRKRKIETKDGIIYKYTIKTKKSNISVNEIEYEIDKKTYDELILDSHRKTIIKTRYIIPYENNLKIELDIFEGEFEGLVFAEIEFESEEEAFNTKMPNWFGKEISKTITNSKMSKMGYKEVLEILGK